MKVALGLTPERVQTAKTSVDAERERRAMDGFTFAGVVFQARPQDLINIAGASTAATLAMLNGAATGDLRWTNPDADFSWIALDNSELPMDAQTMIAFGMAAMAFVEGLIKAGRLIKDDIAAGVFPPDVTTDPRWP